MNTVYSAKDYDQAPLSEHFTATFDHLIPQLGCLQQHAVLHAKEFNLSGWLSVLPLEKLQHNNQGIPYPCVTASLLNLPGTCDGGGAAFTVDHALDFRFGGLVTRRQNEVQDAVGDFASLVWNFVRHQPIVKEAGDDEHGTLIADLAVHGVWQP